MTTAGTAVPAPGLAPELAEGSPTVRPGAAHRRRLAAVASNRSVQASIVAVVALVLRLIAVRTSFDIFIDEVTYTRIGANLAAGQGLVLYGRPFNLHPPAMLATLAVVIKVFGLHGNLEHELLALRPVSAVFGALSCALAYLLVTRAAGRRYALMVAGLVALNPFVILYDSEVMLEAMAQAATVAMIALLAAATWSTTTDRMRRYVIGAGLCGAVVVSTKETFGLVAVVTVVLLWVTQWVLPRRQIALTLAITIAGYVGYVLAVGFTSGFSAWWDAKSGGVLRLVGIRQQTGFNAPSTHVSLLSRVFAHGATDGVTYALLGFGALASLALAGRLRPWRPAWAMDASPRQRTGLLVAIWALCASGYLCYAVVFGSIEEQMFYIMVLPTTAGLFIWVSGRQGPWTPKWRKAGALLLVAALAAEGGVWGVVHTRRDDNYAQFLAWAPTHIPAGSTISVTEDTAQFLIRDAVLGDWTTLAELRAHRVDYVLLSTTLVNQGYGSATKSFEALLNQKAILVFGANGPTTGSLRLYNVCPLVCGAP